MKLFFPIPDKEKNHHSYMVYAMALLWTGVLCGIVSLGFVLLPHLWLRWVTLVPVCLFIGLFTLFMNHKGFTREAAWLLPFMLWGILFLSALSAGGILGTSIFSFMAVILTAGFLLGWQGGVAFGVLTIAGTFALAYLETTGALPVDEVQHTPITRWVSYLIPFGTVVGLQYYFTNHLRSSLGAMQREIKNREASEKEKEATLFHLGERVKELKTLYEVSRILQDENAPLKEVMKDIAECLPTGFQFPADTAARVCLGEVEYASSNYAPSPFHLRHEMSTRSGTKVGVEVVYLTRKPEADEGPFLKEERSMINMLVEMLCSYFERRERTAELLEYKFALDEAAIVSIANVEGELTHVNDNFCTISQYTRSQLVGTHYNIIQSELYPPSFFKELRLKLQTGDTWKGEIESRAKDGTTYWVDTTIVPFLNDEGQVFQYLSICHDITERKKAEREVLESNERLKRIMRHSPVAMALTKANNEVEVFNEQFTKTFGYTLADVPTVEQWWNLAYPDEQYREVVKTEWVARLEQTKSGAEFQTMEASIRCKDGTKRIVEFNYVNLGEEYLVSFHDITELRKGQALLIESEEKNRAMIENMWDGLVLLNSNMQVIYQSPSVERITGFTLADREAKKSGAYSLVYPEDAHILKSAIEKSAASPNIPVHYQIRSIHKSGKVIWLEVSMINLLNNSGINAIMVNYRDITERKNFEEQQALITSIVNSSDDAIISKKLDGTVTSWNKGAEKVLGYSAQEMIGKSIAALIPDDVKGEEKIILARISLGESIDHYETRRVTKNGKHIYVSLTISPIRDVLGNVVGASKILRDVTESKNAENEIRALNESLELKVEQRTAELQEANRMLESFSYSVSHDLRAPVRNISSFAQVLEKMMASGLTPQQGEILHYIKDGADKMNQLINDLLEFSRADRKAVKAETVNMNELVVFAVKNLNTDAAKRTQFTIQELPEVNGDKALLQQVWVNLVSNAVKYSSKKENPQVTIWAERTEKEAVFHIKDNGAGFDMKAADKLFGVFQRLHSANDFEGTGVGLSIVKRIIQKHGGNINASAIPNQGAHFTFSLPGGFFNEQ